MFVEGTILYITPFYFSDGSSKNKFFITLKEADENIIVCALPSSQDYVPLELESIVGCYNNPDKCLSFYRFPDTQITDSGFSFTKTTRIYWENTKTFKKSDLEARYYTQGVDYEVKGVLLPEVMKDLYNCILNSSAVTGKIKKLLRL